MAGFHFSIDDVFGGLIDLSDADVSPARLPLFAFTEALAAEGAVTDLYLFRSGPDRDGRIRRLDEVSEGAARRLRGLAGVRFGPHAENYATAPHAQPIAAQRRTMAGLFSAIGRLSRAGQRSRWLRLHYFSECYELAPLWHAHGVEALLATDKPALAYRLPAAARAELGLTGRTSFAGIDFVRSHLRLESFAAEAGDPPRFLARIDQALASHGFATLFTHEVELADPRVRGLAIAAVRHLAARGAPAL